ncbi:S100 calcium binding protein U [Dunckerocampus dactyliophorus]|uniref:S100 calcium binding protein U n=1 Tax=Dunckerocampus dactyliophorus TaxID=161453 RepID=UPI00240673B9|nr:S100 calcium binding protein U [Dunckerocampus dactyliophorus]XP_054619799.1 S100 calcium binding protein U [Dunckerocampus dactyliophorus]
MEAAIQTVVKVFLKSGKGKESLGKKDFQSLVKSQLSNILSDTDSKEAVNNMGQGLDANQDGKVGFEEYMKLVGYLAKSLSEQRCRAKEEPAQNAAEAPPAAQNSPEGETKADAEVKADGKVDAKADGKVDAKADGKVEVKMEAKVEEAEKKKEEVVEEEKPAAAAAAAATAAAVVNAADAGVTVDASSCTAEVVVRELEETEKVEEVVEKVAEAAKEEAEKKTEDS